MTEAHQPSHSAGATRRKLHNDLVAIVQVIELLRVVTDLNFSAPPDFTDKRWTLCSEWSGEM